MVQPATRRRVLRAISFVLALALIVGAIEAWELLGPGVLLVQVRNSRGSTLDSVVAITSAGTTAVGSVSPETSKWVRVTRLAEGTLVVRANTGGAERDSVEVPVYLMHQSKGVIAVEFVPGAGARWKKWMTFWWDM